MKLKKLLLVSNNNIGFGKSGGDTISINLIKHWQKYLEVTTIGSAEAIDLFKRHHVLTPKYIQTDKVFPLPKITTLRLFLNQVRRFILANKFFFSNFKKLKQFDYVYTASDFYPDFVIGLLCKIFNPKTIWIAGYYLIAPHPWDKNSPYNVNHQTLRGWIYYLGQRPSLFLVRHFADHIFITSDPDMAHFPNCSTFVIQGGVDPITQKRQHKTRQYDAVYLGRFHSQKGVVELIDIWRLVLKKLPKAKLIMIGNGELEEKVKQLISKYKINKNITLVGFKDGPEKTAIFQNSRIVVHPAIYDSGGMAAAEAMAWGLPGVSFDLPALKTYYPRGMIKSTPQDLQDFANNIVKLLTDSQLYRQTSQKAVDLIKNQWSWEYRLHKIKQIIFHQK